MILQLMPMEKSCCVLFVVFNHCNTLISLCAQFRFLIFSLIKKFLDLIWVIFSEIIVASNLQMVFRHHLVKGTNFGNITAANIASESSRCR